MFTSLVVALDLEATGDRALPVVRALSRLADVAVELVTVSSPRLPRTSTRSSWAAGPRRAAGRRTPTLCSTATTSLGCSSITSAVVTDRCW